ncbi:hypothetical protein STUTZSP0542_26160 [Stutzerimonas marianensis]
MGLVKPGAGWRTAQGHMRHGLRTKCVDACQASGELAGDYSPKDGREFAQGQPDTQVRCG